MSNYDRIAISQKPDFYFSSNSSSDQSGKSLYGITNGATNVGQPIIVGNPSSWRIASGESLELDANPIFFQTNNDFEFVIQMMQPDETICIFGDAGAYNGIFVTNGGVEVRFVDSDAIQRSASIPMTKWPEKMHVVVTFDPAYCTLAINGQSTQVSYRETDPTIITDVSFKTTVGNAYYIDGIGVYSDIFQDKSEYINVEDFDYLDFISRTYDGMSTTFDGYRGQPKVEVLNTDFTPDPILTEWHLFTIYFPLSSDEDFDSISIESSLNMPMQYKTNDGSWTSFNGQVSFSPTTDFFILQVRARTQDITIPFIIKVFPMFDDRILTATPAILTPNGGPFYPDINAVAIVNFPEGVELYNISYEGEWLEAVPKTIEILFMPKETSETIVLHSADGEASCGTGGAISGYTAYLNGQPVANLNATRLNQWNHLVLTMTSPVADTFYLNSNAARTGEKIIEYALLTAYPTELSAGTISQMYSIISSYHKLSITENPTDIAEGELDGSSPFKLYTQAWAIIGGGGS